MTIQQREDLDEWMLEHAPTLFMSAVSVGVIFLLKYLVSQGTCL